MTVTVGDNHQGNTAGRDLRINDFYPCKNGDRFLSKADYENNPYCNHCIANSRVRTKQIFFTASSLIFALFALWYVQSVMLSLREVPQWLGHFQGFGYGIAKLGYNFAPLLLALIGLQSLAIYLASRHNKKYYQFHK